MSDIFSGGGGNGVPTTGLGQLLAALGQGMATANNAAAAEPILRAQAAAQAAQQGQPAPSVPAPTPSILDRLTSMFGGGQSSGLGSLSAPPPSSPGPAGGQGAGVLGTLLGLAPPAPKQSPPIPQPMANLGTPAGLSQGATPNAPLSYAPTSSGGSSGLSSLASPTSPPPALPPALGGQGGASSPRAVAYQAAQPPQPTVSPGAPASGPLPTFAQTQGTSPATGPGKWFNGLEEHFNLPQGYLASTMAIEDPSGDPNATSSTGAKGPFQFTKGTAQAYGLTDPTNFGASAYAAAQLAADNANTLRQLLGRDPTSPEIYLAHQQGAKTAAALINNPNAPAGQVLQSVGVSPHNIAVNGGDPNAPAGQFTSMWAAKFGQPGAIGGTSAPGQDPGASQGSPFGSLVGARAALGQGGPPPLMASPGAPGLSPATPFPSASTLGISNGNPGPAQVGQPPAAMSSYAASSTAASAPAAQAINTAAAAAPALSPPAAIDPNDPPVTVPGHKGTWTRASAAATEADDSPDVDDVKDAQDAAAGTPARSYAPPAPPMPSIVNGMPTAATSPVGRQFSITPDMIRSLVQNAGTQQMGLELLKWQAENGNKAPTVYHAGDYVQLPSGQWMNFPTKPDTTDAIKNYQYEQSQGYTKSFQDYQDAQQKGDKGQLLDVPLPSGQMQKVWVTGAQNPSQGTPIGAPYAKQPAIAIDQRAETSSESEFGKAVGQDMGTTLQAGSAAPQALQQIAIMRAAANQAGNNLSTGPLAQYVLKGKQTLGNMLGVEIPGTSEGEVINNIGYGLATQAARAISNRPTQFEFGQALAVKPGLAQSPQGFQAVLNVKEQDLQDQQNLARLLADPANRGPQWPQVKAAYYASHPIMSPFDPSRPLGQADVDALQAASASAPPPPGVPTGARQGNDGNWYVPDPSRQGKFMRVNQ